MPYKTYTLDNKFIAMDFFPDNFTGIVEYMNGDKYWYLNEKSHRINGPAIEYADGEKHWFIDDKRHRIDGPAIEYADGSKFWCIYGKEVTELECKLLYDIMKLKNLL